MTGKTNKTFKKRLKITRRGKVLARQPGQNHFNAKERREKQMAEKKLRPIKIKKKILKKYLPKAS